MIYGAPQTALLEQLSGLRIECREHAAVIDHVEDIPVQQRGRKLRNRLLILPAQAGPCHIAAPTQPQREQSILRRHAGLVNSPFASVKIAVTIQILKRE